MTSHKIKRQLISQCDKVPNEDPLHYSTGNLLAYKILFNKLIAYTNHEIGSFKRNIDLILKSLKIPCNSSRKKTFCGIISNLN